MSKPHLERPIASLGLPQRTVNALLLHTDVRTVGDLLVFLPDLPACQGIGLKGHQAIRRALEEWMDGFLWTHE